MASANPATMPVPSALGRSLTQNAVPLVPRLSTRSPGPQPQTERGRHVVAGAGRHDGSAFPPPARRLGGTEHLGEHRAPRDRVVDQGQQVVAVALLGGRPPAGAGSVAAIGRPPPGELGGQPVVGEEHGGEPREHLGLAAAEPVQLGDGEAGDRDAAAHGRPRRRATGERGDERGRRRAPTRCRSTAWPGRSTAPAASRTTRPCCCAGDGDRRRAVSPVADTPAVGTGVLERREPGAGRLLAAGRCGGRVRRPTGRDQPAGVGVAHLDLARRRR